MSDISTAVERESTDCLNRVDFIRHLQNIQPTVHPSDELVSEVLQAKPMDEQDNGKQQDRVATLAMTVLSRED